MPDVTELREQAARCRRLAKAIGDPRTSKALRDLADEYDSLADQTPPAPRTDRRH